MKVNSITAMRSYSRVDFPQNHSGNPINSANAMKDMFIKSPEVLNPHKQVSFMGYDVHIVDGGNHALNMEHFANALSNDMDVSVHKVQTNSKYKNVKQLKSLEEQLKRINDKKLTDENSYVAIPVFATVPLFDLGNEYKDVMDQYLHLNPQTTKTCRADILKFLKLLYENPEKYRKTIKNLDHIDQGIEYTYGVIREINRLNCKKVYVPADLPVHETLKWKAKERNQEPELKNFTATGYDKDNTIHNMLGECDYDHCYNFNLLALANADVVNLKSIDGETDHAFAAYDTTINDGARGVYNFTPIREDGKIVGYSYENTKTNQYPIEEFPLNDEVSEVQKFVGLDVDEVVADDFKTRQFKQAMKDRKDLSRFSDKLYPVWKVFDDETRRNLKTDLRGDFVDVSLKRFYRKNADNKIIYPDCDCERSGRPSVMAMWGSCFSIFDAIKRDVDNQKCYDRTIKRNQRNLDLPQGVVNLVRTGKLCEREGKMQDAETFYGQAIEMIKMEGFDYKVNIDMMPYEALAELKFNKGDWNGASNLYNFILNSKCKLFLYNKAHATEDSFKTHEESVKLSYIFDKLKEICDKKGEEYPASVCRRASMELRGNSKLAPQIIQRRADEDVHIGDLF